MAERAFSATRLPGFATVAIVVFLALYAPIITLVVFSFNDASSVAVWGGFSWRWYQVAWENTRSRKPPSGR